MMTELSLRQKEKRDLVYKTCKLKQVIKRWLFYAGLQFIQSRDFTEEQEEFLQEVTDFYAKNLENIEKDENFLKKLELGPVLLPGGKKLENFHIN